MSIGRQIACLWINECRNNILICKSDQQNYANFMNIQSQKTLKVAIGSFNRVT